MKYLPFRALRAAGLSALIAAGAFFSQKAMAQSTIANWTFETSQPAATGGGWLTNVAAEVGTGTASAFHTGAAAYSTPSGNGSTHSFSANTWAAGDFWQIAISTVGTNSINLTWDQMSSATGPSQFTVSYSTDGTTFTTFTGTLVITNGSWTTTKSTNITTYHVDFSSVSALNNAPVVYFRIVDAGTTAVNGTTVATAGTDRIDNVLVTGLAGTTGGGSSFIRVETAANGSGTTVPAQSITANSSITVYSILYDASSNFVANVAPDSWALQSRTGGVVAGDLVPAGDGKSATFTGHQVGSATIHASSSTLNTTDSGTITVTAGTASIVRVESAANGSGTVVSAQTVFSGRSLGVYAIRRDSNSNFVDNAAATWSLTGKTGSVVDGDLVVAGDTKSATFTGNAFGSATIHAAISGLTSVDSGLITVTSAPPAAVVISQVYGGGGNSGATYQSDFVELFNRSDSPVNINNWSVQYTSSTGTTYGGSTATQITFTNQTIAAHSYFLIQGAFGANPGTPIPTPDVVNTNLALAATAGKVALVNSATALGAVPSLPDSRIVDLLGYGAVNQAEGTAGPTLANATAAIRGNNGCTDTDNNAVDFTAGTPVARNSASPLNSCPTNTPPILSTIANQAVATNGTTGPVSFTVSDAENAPATLGLAVSSSDTSLVPVGNVVITGTGVSRTVTVTPSSNLGGSAQITITATDPVGASISTSFYVFVGDGQPLGVLFNENFNADPDGTILSFVGDTSGGIWHTHSGTTYQIITSNLAAQVSLVLTNSEDIGAGLSNTVPFSNPATLYLGFTIQETTLPSVTGDYFIHFKDGSSSNFFCKIFASTTNASAGKYRLGISNHGNNPPSAQFPLDLDTNTTYEVVARYKMSTGVATLWVNPHAISDPSVTATDTNSNSSDVSAVALREPGNTGTSSAAGSQAIDNIIVSTVFLDVIPPQPPSLTATHSGSNVVISWPTNNADGLILETTMSLGTNANWTAVTPSPTLVGNTYIVTNTVLSTNVFYRLQGQ